MPAEIVVSVELVELVAVVVSVVLNLELLSVYSYLIIVVVMHII